MTIVSDRKHGRGGGPGTILRYREHYEERSECMDICWMSHCLTWKPSSVVAWHGMAWHGISWRGIDSSGEKIITAAESVLLDPG